MFHQLEGLAIDEDITLADLKGTLLEFARQMFGDARDVRRVLLSQGLVLGDSIDPDSIGEPVSGVTLNDWTWVAATATVPAYCRVGGSMAAVMACSELAKRAWKWFSGDSTKLAIERAAPATPSSFESHMRWLYATKSGQLGGMSSSGIPNM